MASTLKLGNGNWGVKEDSLLAYSDKNNNFLPFPFDFSRASSATVVNKAGLIETVQSGISRIDFKDDANGALLLEPQSTNLITQSEDFSNGSWNKLNVSILSNQITSPNGDINADKITDNTNNARHGLFLIGSWVSGVESVCSVYVKKGTKSKFVIGSTSNAQGSFFNLDTESIINTGSFVGSIVSVGNGWYRCSVVFTAPANYNLFIGLYDIVGNFYYAGTSSYLYIYGAQLEQQSYATSYIPTSGASATRLQDIATNSGNATVINSEEGVLYAEIAALSDDGTTRRLAISDGSTSNRVFIGYDVSTNSVQFVVSSEGSVVVNQTFTISDTTQFNKLALKYKLNDCSFWIDGVKVGTDTTAPMPIGLNEVMFNQGTASRIFFGKVKSLQVYTTALTDAELTTLTTI